MGSQARQNHLEAEIRRLRRKVRALQREGKAVEMEINGYLKALLTKFRQENAQDDWRDFHPDDFKYSLEDILSAFEKEHGLCLPRKVRTMLPIPQQSEKNSKKSSRKRKK